MRGSRLRACSLGCAKGQIDQLCCTQGGQAGRQYNKYTRWATGRADAHPNDQGSGLLAAAQQFKVQLLHLSDHAHCMAAAAMV
jgi:hypothetical protein